MSQISYLKVAGDGKYTQWNTNVLGASDYLMVDDPPGGPDEDVTYLYTKANTSPGDSESIGFQEPTQKNLYIRRLTAGYRVRMETNYSKLGFYLKTGFVVNNSDYFDFFWAFNTQQTYVWRWSFSRSTNPNTGHPWKIDDISNTEALWRAYTNDKYAKYAARCTTVTIKMEYLYPHAFIRMRRNN